MKFEQKISLAIIVISLISVLISTYEVGYSRGYHDARAAYRAMYK